jgi:hypothetical protein
MTAPQTPLRVLVAVVIAAGLVWGSTTLASAWPQSERLHHTVTSVRAVDYATDVAAPGSPFFRSRATYDQ